MVLKIHFTHGFAFLLLSNSPYGKNLQRRLSTVATKTHRFGLHSGLRFSPLPSLCSTCAVALRFASLTRYGFRTWHELHAPACVLHTFGPFVIFNSAQALQKNYFIPIAHEEFYFVKLLRRFSPVSGLFAEAQRLTVTPSHPFAFSFSLTPNQSIARISKVCYTSMFVA